MTIYRLRRMNRWITKFAMLATTQPGRSIEPIRLHVPSHLSAVTNWSQFSQLLVHLFMTISHACDCEWPNMNNLLEAHPPLTITDPMQHTLECGPDISATKLPDVMNWWIGTTCLVSLHHPNHHWTTLDGLKYQSMQTTVVVLPSSQYVCNSMVKWQDPAFLLKDYSASYGLCQSITPLTVT